MTRPQVGSPPRLDVPPVYASGYEKARAVDPEGADRYVAHTTMGDPLADEAMGDLTHLGQRESSRLIQAAMDGHDEGAMRSAPASLRALFRACETPPEWLDIPGHSPGIYMFHRNARLVLGAMVGGTLVEGFATNIAKSFFITGRLRDQGVRRLQQNNRHMIEIFMPGGLNRESDGWKLSVRIRLVHARVRQLLNISDDWDVEALGTPVSAAHLGFAITAFSARLLKHLKSLGARFNDEERASFMQVWRYSGYLMGIPESILFRDEADALEIFKLGLVCEPPPDVESISLANALVNSAPLVVGVTDSDARRQLASYVYRVSRALIGPKLADRLQYPRTPTLGVLWWFRMHGRYDRFMSRRFSNRARNSTNMAALLDGSALEEFDITYRLPDHLYSEASSPW